MADSKITALTALTAADPVNDMFPIVDVSDTTMAASGTTKKISVNNILGASGTATLASATITGDLTVDTSTLKVDSTNNRVGVGTASPATTLDVAGAATITGNVTVKTGNALILNRTDNLTSTQLYDSGSNGFIIDNLNTSGIRLMFGGVTALLLNSTGNLAFPDAKGIDFSAKTPDGSGTVGSEVLNDYEEGTFVPTVRGSTVAGTGVYTTQAGLYTKVGRLVTITVYLNWTAVTLGTGNLQFAGLPFTASSSPVTYNGISIGFVSNIATTAGTVLYGIVEPGSTVITMTQTPTGGGAYGLVPLDTSGEIAFTSTYYV